MAAYKVDEGRVVAPAAEPRIVVANVLCPLDIERIDGKPNAMAKKMYITTEADMDRLSAILLVITFFKDVSVLDRGLNASKNGKPKNISSVIGVLIIF